jgi:hypothetical protein
MICYLIYLMHENTLRVGEVIRIEMINEVYKFVRNVYCSFALEVDESNATLSKSVTAIFRSSIQHKQSQKPSIM